MTANSVTGFFLMVSLVAQKDLFKLSSLAYHSKQDQFERRWGMLIFEEASFNFNIKSNFFFPLTLLDELLKTESVS